MAEQIFGMDPFALRHGDQVCDDNGRPFAMVTGMPWEVRGSAWVHTRGGLPLEFPPGTTVNAILVPEVPQAVINAVIVAAMLDEAYSEEGAIKLRAYQYCDMTPVVIRAESFGEESAWGDLWAVEVQYSSKGGRAVYGVNRNHVPTCYMN